MIRFPAVCLPLQDFESCPNVQYRSIAAPLVWIRDMWWAYYIHRLALQGNDVMLVGGAAHMYGVRRILEDEVLLKDAITFAEDILRGIDALGGGQAKASGQSAAPKRWS